MAREFIWIDESGDQKAYEEGKFYILGAVKLLVEDGKIANDVSKSGHIKGFIPINVVEAYKTTMNKIKTVNKSRTEKKKIRISELHETKIFTDSNSRIVKSWFIEALLTKCEDIEFYYIYFDTNSISPISELKMYKNMLKKLLEICQLSTNSEIVLDLCLDQHGNINEQDEIIEFLKKDAGIQAPSSIKFMESHANYGLQSVDMVIGTIRRHFHKEKQDEKNYKCIEPFIKGFERLYEKDLR